MRPLAIKFKVFLKIKVLPRSVRELGLPGAWVTVLQPYPLPAHRTALGTPASARACFWRSFWRHLWKGSGEAWTHFGCAFRKDS